VRNAGLHRRERYPYAGKDLLARPGFAALHVGTPIGRGGWCMTRPALR
jgi:hypothetical protein